MTVASVCSHHFVHKEQVLPLVALTVESRGTGANLFRTWMPFWASAGNVLCAVRYGAGFLRKLSFHLKVGLPKVKVCCPLPVPGAFFKPEQRRWG